MSLALKSMELTIIPGHYMSVEKIDGNVNNLCCVSQNGKVCVLPHAVTGFDESIDSVFYIPMTSIKYIRFYTIEEEIKNDAL